MPDTPTPTAPPAGTPAPWPFNPFYSGSIRVRDLLQTINTPGIPVVWYAYLPGLGRIPLDPSHLPALFIGVSMSAYVEIDTLPTLAGYEVSIRGLRGAV